MLPRGVNLIVLGLLGFCTGISSAVVAQQTGKSPTANSIKIPYAVEDLTLGDKVDPDSLTSRAYHCSRSEQFKGFTWCTNRSSKGRAYTAYSFLHSPDDKIVYANKTLEPTFSSSAEAKKELQRISRKIGAQPQIIDMPSRRGLPDGLIAVWGDVVLTPVDASNISQLAEGKTPKLGFMVDFVADFQRSAKIGLPIYRIGGGAGSVLAVSYGKPNRGTLRLIAVDASKFAPPATDQAQSPVAAQPPPATDQAQGPVAAQPLPTRHQSAIAAQPSLTLDQTAIVAQPSSQPTSISNESQPNIAELKHTISSLKAELENAAAKTTKLETQNVETERQLKQEAQARLNAEAAKHQIEQTMLESAAQSRSTGNSLWTILASMVFGGLITLLAIRAPALWNQLKESNIALLNVVTPWENRLQRNMSFRKTSVPEGLFGRELDKHVAEINVATQSGE